MLIRSQNGKEIVKCDVVRAQFVAGSFVIWGEGFIGEHSRILGLFGTNEEAMQVIDKINQHIDQYGENKIFRLDCDEV